MKNLISVFKHPLSISKFIGKAYFNFKYGIRIAALIYCLLLLASNHASAQSNNIKLKAHTPFTFELGYERLVNTQHSLAFSLQASAYNHDQILFTDLTEFPSGDAVRLVLEHRSYSDTEKVLNGFYFGQSISYGEASASASREHGTRLIPLIFDVIEVVDFAKGEIRTKVGALGITFGLQKRWQGFNVDLGATLSYNVPFTKEEGITLSNGELVAFPRYIKGPQPTIYIGFGFAF